jgi:group I intron endonuclease
MIVYKYTNLINEKVYIGITTKTIKERHRQHLKSLNDGAYFHNAIKKYGIENFHLEVIDKADSKEELRQLERRYIKDHNSFAYSHNSKGYNCTIGGDGMTGMYGALNHCYGIPFKERIDPKKYEEWLEKIKNPSEDARKKMSKAWQGNKYFLGKKHTEENKKRMSEMKKGIVPVNRRKVNQYDLDGNFIKSHLSIVEATKHVNGKSSARICMCCKKQVKQAYGFYWTYATEKEMT